MDEIALETQKPVVLRLLRLMEFRNTCKAFEGQFTIEDPPDDHLKLTLTQGIHRAALR